MIHVILKLNDGNFGIELKLVAFQPQFAGLPTYSTCWQGYNPAELHKQ